MNKLHKTDGNQKTTQIQSGFSDRQELIQELEKLNEWTTPCSLPAGAPIHAGQPNIDEFNPFPDSTANAETTGIEFCALRDPSAETDEDSDTFDEILEFPSGSLMDGPITFASDGLADAFNT